MNLNFFVLIVFFAVLGLLFILDLFKLAKVSDKRESRSSALRWTVVWIATAMAFSVFIWLEEGLEKFYQFQSAYWIEKSLSIDNLFVFLLIFNYFGISIKAQNKVLLWGILGAIFFRAIFIFGGVWIIEMMDIKLFGRIFNPIIFSFGILLLIGAYKTFRSNDIEENTEFDKGRVAKLLRRFFNFDLAETENFLSKNKKSSSVIFSLLFLILVIVETSDVVFAMDSIPAIFSIAPNDPYILYTSNIFAIMGLRSLYFLIEGYLPHFEKLKNGIAAILLFIGAKMILEPFTGHFNTIFSLLIILGILVFTIIYSVIVSKK